MRTKTITSIHQVAVLAIDLIVLAPASAPAQWPICNENEKDLVHLRLG